MNATRFARFPRDRVLTSQFGSFCREYSRGRPVAGPRSDSAGVECQRECQYRPEYGGSDAVGQGAPKSDLPKPPPDSYKTMAGPRVERRNGYNRRNWLATIARLLTPAAVVKSAAVRRHLSRPIHASSVRKLANPMKRTLLACFLSALLGGFVATWCLDAEQLIRRRDAGPCPGRLSAARCGGQLFAHAASRRCPADAGPHAAHSGGTDEYPRVRSRQPRRGQHQHPVRELRPIVRDSGALRRAKVPAPWR